MGAAAVNVIRLDRVVCPPPADALIQAREVVALRRELDQVRVALAGGQLSPPALSLSAQVVTLQVRLEAQALALEARTARVAELEAQLIKAQVQVEQFVQALRAREG